METTKAARKWLDKNPDAVLLVDESSVHIKTIFGDGYELSLEDFNVATRPFSPN